MLPALWFRLPLPASKDPCDCTGPTEPNNPGKSPQLRNPHLITSAKSLLPRKATWSQAPEIGLWISLGTIILPASPSLGRIYIQKTKIMASGPTISWEIDGETVETVSVTTCSDFGAQKNKV